MSRATARIEEHPAASSNGLLVGVGLGVAFLTFVAFLSVVKQGNLFNESNLLYLALIFYGGASALYIGFGVTGVDRYVKFASIATMIGFAANTLAVGTPLVHCGTSALRQYLRDAAELRMDGGRRSRCWPSASTR